MSPLFAAPGPIELIIIAGMLSAMLAVTVLPFWMICQKAGFPGWYSLATLIPLLNVLLLFYLAFAEWPALRSRPRDEASVEDRGGF